MRAGYPVASSDRPTADAQTLSEPNTVDSVQVTTSEFSIEEDDSLDWFVNLLLEEIASES